MEKRVHSTSSNATLGQAHQPAHTVGCAIPIINYNTATMATLNYNEITPKRIIEQNGEPYEVLSSWVFQKQKRKPVNQVKLRSLKTGSMMEATFHANEKAEEAEVEQRTMKFIFSRNGQWWFCPPNAPADRQEVDSNIIGDAAKFLKENTEVQTLWYDEKLIQVRIPVKVELKVTEAPPSVKGNTAQGGVKQVTLETGAVVVTPLFIEVGDVIRVNTESNSYVERV